MMKKFLSIFAILFVAELSAQTTTSSLMGRITSADGQALVGATVIARHIPSATRYAVAADIDGRYRVEGMRVGGPYSLEVSYVGYTSAKYNDLTLELGRPLTVDVILKNDESIETIVVSADRFNAMRTGAADNFNSTTIASSPTVTRSIYDIVRLSPLAASAKSGGVSILGANSRYNAFCLDGIAAGDIYGLTSTATNGGLAGANPIPLDAIDEIQISASPFDVRQSGFTGGGINAVTKAGTNTFGGSAYTYYNDQHFYGRGNSKLTRQSTQIYGASLGGAIVRDKLFFFVNGELNYDSSPSSYYPGYDGANITEADLQAISNRYAALTGNNGGGYGRRNVVKRSGSALARLDWNINDSHKMTLRYTMLDARQDYYQNSASSFMFGSAGYASISRTHSIVGELNSRLNQSVFNVVRVGYTRVTDGRDNDTLLPNVHINSVGGKTSVDIGTNAFSGVNRLTQNSITLSDEVSVYARDHAVTFGTSNDIYLADNLYMSDAFGSYTYNTLEDFLAGNPSKYAYNYAITGDPTVRMRTAQFGLYVQDEWQASKRVVVTYGIRADIPIIFNNPKINDAFNADEIAINNGVRVGNKPKTNVMFSPRVGLRWMAADDGKGRTTLLRGGVGLFTGRVPFVWITNCYSNTGMTTRGYSLTNPADIPAFGEKPDASVGVVSNPSICVVSTKFRYPQALRLNVALEQTFAGGWYMAIEGLYTKTFNDLVMRNLVAEDKGEKLCMVNADMATEQNSTTFYNSSSRSRYASVYYLTNTDKNYSYAVTASLRKRFDFGLDLSVAYTFSHAYTVMDGISSNGSSIWGKSYNVASNSPSLGLSVFDTPHKITATLTFSRRYGGLFGSTLSLVYQAYSGARYTPTYYRTSIDLNGDSSYGNTPLYIPTNEELDKMNFATDADRDGFDKYIAGSPYLRSHRGRFVARNAMQLPFEHHLDLHFAQDFYFSRTSSRKLQLTLDVMNFGNMLSRKWGAYYYISDWKLSPVAVTSLDNDGAGHRVPTYSYRGASYSKNDLLSRWHLQLGARVVF